MTYVGSGMAERRTIFLDTKRGREHAKQMIDRAPEDYVCRVSQRTRTDDQNRKLWPMLADIQRQVPEMTRFSAEDLKLRFLNALGAEMRFLPELEGAGVFPVGLRSSTLTVEQFSALIELLFAFGAKHGVVWTKDDEPAQGTSASGRDGNRLGAKPAGPVGQQADASNLPQDAPKGGNLG